jgi:predicted transcriptional regulator
MPRPPSTQPTDVELEILQVLWELGPSTLGFIHDRLAQTRPATYVTTQKMVRVMVEKGLVLCDDSIHPRVYQAARPKDETQRHMVSGLADKAFSGSAAQLVMSLLSSDKVDRAELAEIRRLIVDAETSLAKPRSKKR